MERVDPNAVASWSQDAAGYERARPGWPSAALDWLAARLDLGPGATVVDLAAGTGKLTRDLVGRVGRVVAVEPLAGMRAELERAVPAAEIVDGLAAALPLPDSSADAVVIAEAFHWFATPGTLAELQRVLAPGAGVGLLWNLEQWTDDAWVQPVKAALPEPVKLHPTPRATWDVLAADAGFTAPVSVRLTHEHHLDAAGFADLVGSWSRIATRPAIERAQIRERLLTLVPAHVSLRYETVAVAARTATV